MNETWPQARSPEDEFLLACARIELEAGHHRRLEQLLAAGLDWARLLSCAVRQGIPTLVYHHLRSLDGRAALPPPLWATLERAYHLAGWLALRQQFEAGRLLDAFHHAGVDVIALKGLALRGTVYRNPALRPSGDVDLLVRPADIHPAETILQGLGYEPAEAVQTRNGYRPGVFHHLVPYRLPGRGVQVEIHWDLAPPQAGLRIDTEGLWQRATPGQVAGRAARHLAPEDLLLHLALHASILSRFQTGLRHLVDVAEAAHSYRTQLDWQELAIRAEGWGGRHPAYLTTQVAHDLLGATALDGAIGALRPAQFDERLLAAARQRVVDLSPLETPEIVTETLACFLLAGSVDRLRLLPRILFPSRERMAHLYQVPPESRKLPGYYLLRPFQLLGRHTRLLVGIARGAESAVTLAESRKEEVLLERWLRGTEETR
jgi:hypothetical protein